MQLRISSVDANVFFVFGVYTLVSSLGNFFRRCVWVIHKSKVYRKAEGLIYTWWLTTEKCVPFWWLLFNPAQTESPPVRFVVLRIHFSSSAWATVHALSFKNVKGLFRRVRQKEDIVKGACNICGGPYISCMCRHPFSVETIN